MRSLSDILMIQIPSIIIGRGLILTTNLNLASRNDALPFGSLNSILRALRAVESLRWFREFGIGLNPILDGSILFRCVYRLRCSHKLNHSLNQNSSIASAFDTLNLIRVLILKNSQKQPFFNTKKFVSKTLVFDTPS